MKTACAELEARLEALVAGDLDPERRAECESHLRRCDECASLVELATVPLPALPADDCGLVDGVLGRTSGGACERAAELLAAAPGEAGAGDSSPELVELHLEHCPGCRRLAEALAAIDRDLPALAEIAPPAGFVTAVLAASLPLPVRLRRWWRRTWPAWLRRPRFALEAAYAMTALLVVVINLPGTPLAAMPRQAVEIARSSPIEALEQPMRDGLAAWERSAARDRLEASWTGTRSRVRTFFGAAASWWENATEGTPSRPAETTEESS